MIHGVTALQPRVKILGIARIEQRVAGTVVAASPLTLSQLHFLDPFLVVAQTANAEDRVEFELALSEWLPAFAEFLNNPASAEASRQLIFSGEWFRAFRYGGEVVVPVYDVVRQTAVELQMDGSGCRKFYYPLRAAFLAAIVSTEGALLIPDDISRLDLTEHAESRE